MAFPVGKTNRYRKMITLYKHNQIAYASALELLRSRKRAAVIHPTGTGKSLIAFKLCEDFPEKRMLWLSPSSYIFKTQTENLAQMTDGFIPQNIRFLTYAKLMLMDEGKLSSLMPDNIILDEFHRCGADQWGNGVRRLLEIFPQVPVLGLSATAIRYLDHQRDMADELFDGNVASEMSLGEAIVRGILNPPRYITALYSYRKSLDVYGRRIVKLHSPERRQAAEQALERFRRALEQAEGLDVIFDRHMTSRHGKYIVFCANAAHMREMMTHASEWFGKVDPCPRMYSVYTADPSASLSFRQFKEDQKDDHLRLLYCIDALNEGIHIDGISGVILLRPTVSPIIYKQQIGRALAAGRSESAVIFDVVLNIENLYSIGTLEEEMQLATVYYRSHGRENEIVNEHFSITDETKDSLRLFGKLEESLSASWETMYAQAKAYYQAHGDLQVPKRYRTEDGYALGSWIHTQRKVRRQEQYGHLDAQRIALLDEIGMVWENVKDLQWNKNFVEARRYYETHGDLLVPAGYVTAEGTALGRWIANLRMCRKNGIAGQSLTEQRIRQLDQIGMVWNVTDHLWDSNYAAAKAYYEAHGNLAVPADYVDTAGVRLGAWIRKLRQNRKTGSGKLTEGQIALLDTLQMQWNGTQEQRWQRGYEAACQYHRTHGNLNVPSGYATEDGFRLGSWLKRQRTNVLTGAQKEKLDMLGMVWEKEDPWEKRYELLKKYQTTHGDINTIPADYVSDGVWLGKWVSEQKAKLAGNALNKEQMERLQALGLKPQGTRDLQWERSYAQAKAYYTRQDGRQTTAGPAQPEQASLQLWIKNQIRKERTGRLEPEKMQKLEALGIVPAEEDAWEKGYRYAADYARQHGNLNASVTYVCADGFRLGNWLSNRRNDHNHPNGYHRMSREQTAALEALGMIWDMNQNKWDRSFQAAERFYRTKGNLEIPADYQTEDGICLGTWLEEQRRAGRAGKLKAERAARLEAIGMDWRSPSERQWEKGLQEAGAYYQEHGNLQVPVTYRSGSGFCLGRWVKRQRENKEKLDERRIALLDRCRMVWDETGA